MTEQFPSFWIPPSFHKMHQITPREDDRLVSSYNIYFAKSVLNDPSGQCNFEAALFWKSLTMAEFGVQISGKNALGMKS